MKCVQCTKCEKWRVLDSGVNLESLDENWTCEINEDKSHNNCDIGEEVVEKDLIESNIGPGSIVWAKLNSQYWPSIICAQPHTNLWIKTNSQNKKNGKLVCIHVGFLGGGGHNWVFEKNLHDYLTWTPLTHHDKETVAKANFTWNKPKFALARSWADELCQIEDLEDRLGYSGYDVINLEAEDALQMVKIAKEKKREHNKWLKRAKDNKSTVTQPKEKKNRRTMNSGSMDDIIAWIVANNDVNYVHSNDVINTTIDYVLDFVQNVNMSDKKAVKQILKPNRVVDFSTIRGEDEINRENGESDDYFEINSENDEYFEIMSVQKTIKKKKEKTIKKKKTSISKPKKLMSLRARLNAALNDNKKFYESIGNLNNDMSDQFDPWSSVMPKVKQFEEAQIAKQNCDVINQIRIFNEDYPFKVVRRDQFKEKTVKIPSSIPANQISIDDRLDAILERNKQLLANIGKQNYTLDELWTQVVPENSLQEFAEALMQKHKHKQDYEPDSDADSESRSCDSVTSDYLSDVSDKLVIDLSTQSQNIACSNMQLENMQQHNTIFVTSEILANHETHGQNCSVQNNLKTSEIVTEERNVNRQTNMGGGALPQHENVPPKRMLLTKAVGAPFPVNSFFKPVFNKPNFKKN